MSDKPYKALGIDLLASALHDREQAIDTFIACSRHMETTRLDDDQAGPKAFQRLRAAAVNENLRRHLAGIDHAIEQNAALIRDIVRAREATVHLRALRVQAAAAAEQLDAARANIDPSRPPSSPTP